MFAIHCAAEAVNSPKIQSGQEKEKEQDMMVREGGGGCMVAVAL